MTVTNPGIQIAKKNIFCYKYLDFISETQISSACEGFRYTLGRLYKEIYFINRVQAGDDLRGGGFHSYRNINAVSSYIHSHSLLTTPTRRAVLCIIPKGSKYIFGEQDGYRQYYSEKIILKKVITDKVVKELKRKKKKLITSTK